MLALEGPLSLDLHQNHLDIHSKMHNILLVSFALAELLLLLLVREQDLGQPRHDVEADGRRRRRPQRQQGRDRGGVGAK